MRLLLRVVAWLLLAGLVFVTLSPIDLRPISPLPTQLERAAALAVVGFVFAIAYPRRILLVALLVLGATVMLEVLQLASLAPRPPDRRRREADRRRLWPLLRMVGGAASGAAPQ